MKKTQLDWQFIYDKVKEIAEAYPTSKFWGIPRGGQIIAGLTGRAVNHVEQADIIIDDIIDSGKTKERYKELYGKPVIGLIEKDNRHDWLVFPWEIEDTTKDAQDLVVRILEQIGDNPNRDGIVETPDRVVRSWSQLFSGYHQNPKDHVKVFEKGKYDQMVILKDCEMYSTCEHHMQPFFGKIHIGYLPDKKVIGLSKLARIAEVFSRRLQIQERIGDEVTDFLMKELGALGAGCVIEAKHFCVMARGVEKQNSIMVTSSLKGKFRTDKMRFEFLDLVMRRNT